MRAALVPAVPAIWWELAILAIRRDATILLIWRDLAVLTIAGYTLLVSAMALTAAYSPDPDRRKAALAVLRVLVGRRLAQAPAEGEVTVATAPEN